MSFFLRISGQLESGSFYNHNGIYCKVSTYSGPDWVLTDGPSDLISQLSKQNKSLSDPHWTHWNLPLEWAWKTTNPFGWPQICVCVYGIDMFGRDVILGYGAVRLPTKSGHYTLTIPTFAPTSSSPFVGILGLLTGRYPEFLDSKFPCKNEGREVTRVSSDGMVQLSFELQIKDMESHGYHC